MGGKEREIESEMGCLGIRDIYGDRTNAQSKVGLEIGSNDAKSESGRTKVVSVHRERWERQLKATQIQHEDRNQLFYFEEKWFKNYIST